VPAHPATDTCALYAGEILHADIVISGRSCTTGPGSIHGVVHTGNRCDRPDKLINRWQKKHATAVNPFKQVRIYDLDSLVRMVTSGQMSMELVVDIVLSEVERRVPGLPVGNDDA